MKFFIKISLNVLLLVFLSSSASSQEITFISKIHDYGSITKNQDGRGIFRFVNTGDAPLVISQVKSSCGCLVPMWLRKPVQPGDTAIIGCRYDTKRVGPINKSMTVISNALNEPRLVVRIKGFVYLQFVELNQSEFNYDLGTLDFNEFKTIDLELVSKDSVSRIWLKTGRNRFIEPTEYSDMIKFSKNEVSDWRKQISLNFTNIYGDVGKQTFKFKIQYNNKRFATISVTANFTGYPDDGVFNTKDTSGYVFRNKNLYFENNQISRIVIEEKSKYDKNPEFRIAVVKNFKNGIIDTVEKRSYYNNKVYLRYYKLEEDELLFLYKEERDL